MAAPCTHLDEVSDVEATTPAGCKECLEEGTGWVQLRLCRSCGHVGCCDSSPRRHATAHHRATSHPIIRSFEPGQDWSYCYVDEVMLTPA